MERIKILSEEKIITLKTNIKTIQELMISSKNGNCWLKSFFKEENPFLDSKYMIEDFELDFSKDNPVETDCENAKRLFINLKHLPESVLCDERLWIGLAFGKFYNYMEYRWNSNKSINIKSRWLLDHGQKRGLFFNGLARLFWFAKYSYDASLSNPFELTEYCFKYNDILVQMVYRSYSNSSLVRMSIIKAHKRFIEDGGSINVEIYKNTLKYVSFLGGAYLLDSFSENELIEKIYNYLVKNFSNVSSELIPIKENKNQNTLSSETPSVSTEDDGIAIINFDKINNLSFTKATSYCYKNSKCESVVSWRILYEKLLKELYNDNILKFKNLANNSEFLYLYNDKTNIHSPVMIGEDIYVECNRSAIDLIKALKSIMDKCGIAYDQVVIKYKKTEIDNSNNSIEFENDKEEQNNANIQPKTENIIGKFILSLQKMNMSYSYKPILIKSIIKNANKSGIVTIQKIIDYFKSFYESRREKGLVVEKSNSLFINKNYTNSEAKNIIIQNPIKVFEKSNALRYDRNIGCVIYTYFNWSTITEEDKKKIDVLCDEKLNHYYTQIK